MRDFMILIRNQTVYVKERAFFESQGGFREKCGANWMPIRAKSITEARIKGEKLMKGRSHLVVIQGG